MMSTGRGILYADPWSIERGAVQEWAEGFSWPVSDAAYDAICSSLLDAYEARTAACSGRDRDLLVGSCRFLFVLMQVVHGVAVAAQARAQGMQVRLSDAAVPYFTGDAAAFVADPKPLKAGAAALMLRRLAKRWSFASGGKLTKAWRTMTGSDTWSLGSWCSLKGEYCDLHGLFCDHLYPPQIIGSVSRSATVGPVVESAVRDVCALAAGFAAEFGGELDAEGFAAIWLDLGSRLAAAYDKALGVKRKPARLLVSEVGNPWHKVISLAMRRAGVHVVGFHHGNDVVNAWERQSALTEYVANSEFVCPTEAMAQFHEQEYRLSPLGAEGGVCFTATGSGRYQDLYEIGGSNVPGRVRTVMVMGYPMNYIRYPFSAGDYSLYQLDVERRIMRALKVAGFTVIYKVHPECQEEARGLFDGLYDAIEPRPFEQVALEADAYVFGCTTSTTFGHALCLPRHVVVLDFENKDWNPEAYGLLRERCSMVPTGFDEVGRVRFDPAYVAKALSGDLPVPDYSYVERLMCP